MPSCQVYTVTISDPHTVSQCTNISCVASKHQRLHALPSGPPNMEQEPTLGAIILEGVGSTLINCPEADMCRVSPIIMMVMMLMVMVMVRVLCYAVGIWIAELLSTVITVSSTIN